MSNLQSQKQCENADKRYIKLNAWNAYKKARPGTPEDLSLLVYLGTHVIYEFKI